jgi:hypothetical protein
MTQSGKTTLATDLSRKYKADGWGVLVHDPLRDSRWHCDQLFTDFAQFQEVAKQSRRCMLFVDESGETVGQHDSEAHWLATRGRHNGHMCHFISQRAQQVATLARHQCSYLYCFNVSSGDAKLLADEWNKAELREAHTLDKGEFFACQRFGGVERLRAF